MKHFLNLLFLLLCLTPSFGTANAPAHTSVNSCSKAFLKLSILPPNLKMGAMTIHRYDEPMVKPSRIAVTVWSPLPDAKYQGHIVNLNKELITKESLRPYIIGDGSLRRTFLGVDARPGTDLDRILLSIENDYSASDYPKTKEGFLRFVTYEVRAYLNLTPQAVNDTDPYFSWDKALTPPAEAEKVFAAVAFESIFHSPLALGEARWPIIPLEKYFQANQGYCLQSAVAASLLLARHNIPHRLVNGANSIKAARNAGHVWIELEDQRVIDPTWRLMANKIFKNPLHPSWFWFDRSYRFENQSYPALILSLGQ